MREGTGAADLQGKDVSVQKDKPKDGFREQAQEAGRKTRRRLSTHRRTSGREDLLHSAHCAT